MKNRLIIGFACALVAGASGALAQTADPAVWRPLAQATTEAGPPTLQLIQQDRGGADRDRMRRGERPNRDEDDDDDGYMGGPGGAWRPGMLRQGMGQGMGQGMRQSMMSNALGGTRIHLRRGDSAVSMRCPTDVRLNDCIDAVGRLLDRLSTMGTGTGSGPGTPAPR